MTTTVADRALLDTNVLLAATDQGRPEHARALAALNDWPAAGATLYTSGQVLREYLAVATRTTERNGLGMTRSDATANVRTLRGRLRFLAETEKVTERLLAVLGDVKCTGKQVHDANVVATMLAHGIATLVTLNTGDFARFNDHVHVIPLLLSP